MSQEAPQGRARIQNALIELCLERSYAGVTLPDLLRRAGVDDETFHCYFDDLEDCFCSFYEEMRDEFMLRVGESFAGVSGWREQIRAAAWAIVDYILEDPGRARISFVEVWFAGERAKLIREQAMSGLFALIDQGRLERADSFVSSVTAEFVGSAVYRRLQAAIESGDLSGLEAEVPELMYAVVLPYLGREAAEEELRMPRPERR
ncbi:MAG TPA: TetR/AcrR family transcriptional regulator [Solirubrobacterales bacterium]|nr:TetR/AcrR family transcriptional regulator [Solirubrobacterales bacterium]